MACKIVGVSDGDSRRALANGYIRTAATGGKLATAIVWMVSLSSQLTFQLDHSMEAGQSAQTVTSSPTLTGEWKLIPSTATVAHRP